MNAPCPPCPDVSPPLPAVAGATGAAAMSERLVLGAESMSGVELAIDSGSGRMVMRSCPLRIALDLAIARGGPPDLLQAARDVKAAQDVLDGRTVASPSGSLAGLDQALAALPDLWRESQLLAAGLGDRIKKIDQTLAEFPALEASIAAHRQWFEESSDAFVARLAARTATGPADEAPCAAETGPTEPHRWPDAAADRTSTAGCGPSWPIPPADAAGLSADPMGGAPSRS